MRIKLPHTPYIARKIAIDLLNSKFVTLNAGIEPIAEIAQDILTQDVKKEKALEEKVNELLESNEDEMDLMQIDRKNMFWLVKKKLASEFDVILSFEDRYSNVAHIILDALLDDVLIEYNVSENRVKNIIYNSIDEYLKIYEKIEDDVLDKIENYKRKLIPGSEEYDLVFEKLYQDELQKRGML
ncbi:DUF507 family protein [Campylobacter pinnipediorum]|uniref:Competence protein n=1 Tax=Campylobacter pinnipediorum subsp. pinnipediorum TaxID=1660067 RepID=A0AAX0LCC7_9BACT|nr:DUF507 family protein [Campylobacter pinnipediorum]AQW80643.1 putative DUF507 domain protein [Campylobacter pinnipediorum subsp. pinnipediorum]AQW82311.1 putative DUF507 domain protein [Campylobacter pinnipediorum subsp. pinnipediorum]OPA76585.1 competence protein [Campylobacter pinnipediorum subsp. pinnipediorum]OPA82030.1 competence protein [Campylobacter pinnipediorum subsp. pinnipediorum]